MNTARLRPALREPHRCSRDAACIVLFPGAAHASMTSPPLQSDAPSPFAAAAAAAAHASSPRRASAEKHELLSAATITHPSTARTAEGAAEAGAAAKVSIRRENKSGSHGIYRRYLHARRSDEIEKRALGRLERRSCARVHVLPAVPHASAL